MFPIGLRLPRAGGRRIDNYKAEFFRDEQAALEPFQPGLFDDLING